MAWLFCAILMRNIYLYMYILVYLRIYVFIVKILLIHSYKDHLSHLNPKQIQTPLSITESKLFTEIKKKICIEHFYMPMYSDSPNNPTRWPLLFIFYKRRNCITEELFSPALMASK